MPTFDQIEHVGLTDVGIRRSHNQDAFSVQKAADVDHWEKVGHVFLVADGMGGHAVGEKASAKAVQEIPLIYAKHAPEEGAIAALKRAFTEANAGIFAIGQSNPEFRGLGTTSTALVLRGDGAWVAHVGDSRVYRIREGKIEQLSFDHSYAWEMARRLGIPPEELSEVKKNVIVRSLGPDSTVQVDIEGPYPVYAGDVYVLCSDGLCNPVTPEEIGTVALALPPNDAARFLIELANLRGGPDNITVIVVRVGGEEMSTMKMDIVPEPRWKMRMRRVWNAWHRAIPWPLSVLGAGLLLAILFVVFATTNTPGSSVIFVVATLTIIAGFVGLFFHQRKEQQLAQQPQEVPRKLNIYRQHPCRIERSIVEKLMKLEAPLREQLQGIETPPDWALYDRLHTSATERLNEGDYLAAFRDQCLALSGLAQCINRSKQKSEGFRPKWETTTG